jgi:hypothetical protein
VAALLARLVFVIADEGQSLVNEPLVAGPQASLKVANVVDVVSVGRLDKTVQKNLPGPRSLAMIPVSVPSTPDDWCPEGTRISAKVASVGIVAAPVVG